MLNLWINGISVIADDVEGYQVQSYPVDGEYSVKIDLSDFDSNEGKVLYDDGENQIYVEKVFVNGNSDYEVSFMSSGTYSLRGATVVSGSEHARTENGFTHINQVNATATFQDDIYKIYPSSSSGLNYKDGDSFAFYLFPHDKEVEVDIEKDSIIEVKLSNLYMLNWEK
ncbi:hypothetical protein [Psychrobacillus sp. OK028]|uniref:hypothetical protein n=1 Tax=Psychrobacillus sp. OK028 TaxID=1884359 RepID=UPI0011132DCF|nr:hypothetical protein [Psychrobacillus sp. OK028]